MANPFDSNWFTNIFNTAFSHPFFTQNNPFSSNFQPNQQQQQQQQQPRSQTFFNPPQFSQVFTTTNSQQQPNQQQQQQQQQQQSQQSQQIPNFQQNFNFNFNPSQNGAPGTSFNFSQNFGFDQNDYDDDQEPQQANNNQNFQNYQYANNGFNNQNQNQQQQRTQYQQDPNQFKSSQSVNENSGKYQNQQGNIWYQKGNYQKAIEFYTKAIKLDDTQSIYFSNRARCYKSLGNYQSGLKDALEAVELDDKNIKANFLCGQFLCQLGKIEQGVAKIVNGITKMVKAMTLCTGNKKVFEKDIALSVLRAKKLLWYKQQYIEIEENKQILLDLIEIINSDLTKTNEEKQKLIENVKTQYVTVFDENLFQIPDQLCCKITLELMEDPYITPAGVTYERDALLDHINTNGCFDPITREPINKDMIYPNLAVKQQIREFLEKNPWAYEYEQNENYLNINF